MDLHDDAWDDLRAPCLTMMGTLDHDFATTDALTRRAPFDFSNAPEQYLVTLDGATHGAFDNKSALPTDRLAYGRFRGCIVGISTAFFDAYLRDDAAARAVLTADPLTELTDGNCTIEFKNVTSIGEKHGFTPSAASVFTLPLPPP